MKKFGNKKPKKSNKNVFSPITKKHQIIFGRDLFEELEKKNNIVLSHKKSQEELLLTKQKITSNKYHRRTNSNSENYNNNITKTQNYGINSYLNKLNFINKKNKNEKEIEKETENNKKILNTRNNNIYPKMKQKKESNNILLFSFSLKDFRKSIIDCYSSNNNYLNNQNNQNNNIKYYNNEIKLKNNKNLYFSDNTNNTNREETRNTTSININNSNLKKSKINEKEKEKENKSEKSIKYIKINRKHKRKLYSSMDNNLKINNTNINNTQSIKEKICSKINLHPFIYNTNYIKTNNNINRINNYNYIHNSNSNIKIFNKKESYFSKNQKDKKLFLINPISDSYYKNTFNCCYKSELEFSSDIILKTSNFSPKKSKFFNRNNFPSTTKNNNKNKNKIINNFTFIKNKNGMHRSQENFYKNKLQEIEYIKEFHNVEEIHFMFVQMNQSKKYFFEKYDINKK